MSGGLVGKVCRCSRGELGLVTGRKRLPWGTAWVGVPLNRTGLWSSGDPKVVAENLDEYLKQGRKAWPL